MAIRLWELQNDLSIKDASTEGSSTEVVEQVVQKETQEAV